MAKTSDDPHRQFGYPIGGIEMDGGNEGGQDGEGRGYIGGDGGGRRGGRFGGGGGERGGSTPRTTLLTEDT
ncbi:hypothetical protein AKJ16_DCAP04636 [Drosera capensis]